MLILSLFLLQYTIQKKLRKFNITPYRENFY